MAITNSVEINMTEDDIQELMDRVQRLNGDGNDTVFNWFLKDANGEHIDVVISVGDDPE